MFEEYKDIMSAQDVCAALDIGKNSVYKLLNSKQLKSIRIGNVHKIPKSWLIEYLYNAA